MTESSGSISLELHIHLNHWVPSGSLMLWTTVVQFNVTKPPYLGTSIPNYGHKKMDSLGGTLLFEWQYV